VRIPRFPIGAAWLAKAPSATVPRASAASAGGDRDYLGSTRYRDIVAGIGRVEIGYTWYAVRLQRTHVNTACNLLLLQHTFESLGCGVVGLRTDRENTRSQAAIERLGAHRDGVLRHFQARKDGSPRDTVMYSILRAEWPTLRHSLRLLMT
jgi:RimJ/RimL family protein N-acetyltransferase